MRRIALPTLIAFLLASGSAHAVDVTVPAARDTEPVILTGAHLGEWATPSNQTVKLPLMDLQECQTGFDPEKAEEGIREGLEEGVEDGAQGALQGVTREEGCHNRYSDPEVDTGVAGGKGTPVDRIVAFRWSGGFTGRWVEVPIQVDEQFTRYLDNSASGFSPYSGQDQHTTYAYDREGFRWRAEDPGNPCLARPDSPVAKDPVQGLDHNDEVVFMASDAGPAARGGAPKPEGVEALKMVVLEDPANDLDPRYLYIGRTDGTRRPAFDGSNGYVRYQRDANADVYEFSQSSYDNYGNAPVGMTCDADGNPTGRVGRRRPRDYATISTDRYRFRYDGRWLMTKVEISGDGGRSYGPDLVDRWKARAFAQDPGSETPCCGFEEEDTNWGGSSSLLGEKVGPVRAIRETWGADSGTNVVRRETFYRREMRQKTWLRVHVIPPLDGIYAQWDFNAGRVTRFFNERKPEGVDVDGRNDEVMGNLDDPCQPKYDRNDTGELDQRYRSLYEMFQFCRFPYHLSADLPDLTHSEPGATLGWSQVAGPNGTIVDRYDAQLTSNSAGGAAQGVFAFPYYRDDSCFDDGTGSDPGPKVRLRSGDEPTISSATGQPRTCWKPEDGLPDGTDRYYQGSIATHGLHILLVADSDNARLTVPTTEIVGEQRMVMLPGFRDARAGEQYGRGFEKPLGAAVLPAPQHP
ncbi:MAG TPA: hypothetical protein VHF89_17690 [Solirubrobacteraceae bacterium]|nr:hypothetical protein [Solirubrobacteraceae bacterium]